MKKFYKSNLYLRLENHNGSFISLFFQLLFFVVPFALSSQITYTFTNCGATGKFGPTQGQVNAAYAATNLNGTVVVTGNGIQTWTVPTTGLYRIETYGAQGGTESVNKYGGRGAIMRGDFNLT